MGPLMLPQSNRSKNYAKRPSTRQKRGGGTVEKRYVLLKMSKKRLVSAKLSASRTAVLRVVVDGVGRTYQQTMEWHYEFVVYAMNLLLGRFEFGLVNLWNP